MPDSVTVPARAPGEGELATELVRIGRSHDARAGAPEILSTRHGVLVVRVGDVVVKAHPVRTDRSALAVRLRVATDPLLRDLVVPPLRDTVLQAGGRAVTVWPAGETVRPDAVDAPWEEGAALLARLHAVPVEALPGPLPSADTAARVRRAVERLTGDGPAASVIRRAYATLPERLRTTAPAGRPPGGATPRRVLVHGDWHLGQLARTPGHGWRLIDIDDLGTGPPPAARSGLVQLLFGERPGTDGQDSDGQGTDGQDAEAPAAEGSGPEWDLARPAGLYAAGVLPPDVWDRFLRSYRAAGGRAVPADGDPWGILDTPAKALAIQIAATCVIVAKVEDRPLDESETALVRTCSRIAGERYAP